MRILLVEDDLMIGDVVANSLRDASYAVDWMKNGNDALASCFAQHYDIVLLDLGLPGQDGFSVMNALRRQGSSVPVVIVTARDALTDRLHGLDSGADDYLIKPFEFSELLARIRAVLRRHNGNSDRLLSNGVLSLNPVSHEVCLLASGENFLEDIYVQDTERKQSFGEAVQTYHAMAEAYGRCGYNLIRLPLCGPEERAEIILSSLYDRHHHGEPS
ncbi:response regulator [Enterobacter hormaechei]|uniref:response regulator n=1 Tax=Enterobacter hormaechei TaxID=158836 RepID=UPI0031E151FF